MPRGVCFLTSFSLSGKPVGVQALACQGSAESRLMHSCGVRGLAVGYDTISYQTPPPFLMRHRQSFPNARRKILRLVGRLGRLVDEGALAQFGKR